MIKAGQYIKDGNTEFIVCDIRDNTPVGTLIYDLYLHDGYIKANGTNLLKSDIPRINRIAILKNLFSDTKRGFYKNIDELTIGIPDYRDIFIMSTDSEEFAGEYVEAGLPNITGYLAGTTTTHSSNGNGSTGALYWDAPAHYGWGATTTDFTMASGASFDASRSNAIYGKSETVQPPAIKLIAQIKY